MGAAHQDAEGRWVSDDGQWWWNGKAWQPATSEPPPAPPGDVVEPTDHHFTVLEALTAAAGTPNVSLPQPSTPASMQAAWETVNTDGGSVSLAPLESVTQRVAALKETATQFASQAASLRSSADVYWAESGAILAARANEWSPTAQLAAVIARVQPEGAAIANDEEELATLKASEATAGLVAKIRVRHQESVVEKNETRGRAIVHPILVQIGREAPPTTLPEADRLRSQASAFEQQASSIDAQITSATSQGAALEEEAARRQQAIKSLGFDAPYEAARLATTGPTPIESPLVLKAHEKAYFSMGVRLARMVSHTRYVGGSSGFSIPIGHTGIRYRVGSFHGHPIQSQSLNSVDDGTLVLTNQRVAYVGRTKSIATPLAKIMHVEVYTDGLSIAREGKENPDWYLNDHPQHFLFLLNWFLDNQSVGTE